MSGQNQVIENQIKENILLIENEISIICAEKNSKIIKEQISQLSDNDGGVCRLNMWRLKQKLCPRNIEPPMAKKGPNGDLISNPPELKQLYVDTYKHRLRHRVIKPGYEQLESLKNFLFNVRLSLSKTRKSDPWTKDQLINVLQSLKTGKSCDALGYSNELFKPK